MEKIDCKQRGMRRVLIAMAQRPAFCLFMFFISFFYLTNAGWYKIGDENALSIVARNIAYEKQIGFNLDDFYKIENYGDDYVKGTNGLYYLKWGLGQSLVEVPFYFFHRALKKLPLRRHATVFFETSVISELMIIFFCPSAVSALGCVLIFLMSMRLGCSKRVSLFVSLIYGIGTMVWPYSKSLASETTLNVAILGAVYAAISYSWTRRRWWLAISGACMGFALVTKVISIVFVPVLVLYILFTVHSRRALFDVCIFFTPPFLALLGVQLWHNVVRYDSLLHFGYDRGWDVLGFSTPLYVGLWGFIASPGKSFFLYSPITILGLISAWDFYQKRRYEALLFLGIIILFTIPHARWCSWTGDWAWGPRFLLVITPYMILPAGLFFEKWRRVSRLKRALVTMLFLFSLAIQILGVAIHPFQFIQARTRVVEQLVELKYQSYLSLYSENAFVNFSPIFSHIAGNWWLLKHALFSYEIRSDVPWRVLGDFKTTPSMWMNGNRTIPFWWPVAFPIFSPYDKIWIYPFAIANLLMVFWWGLRLKRCFYHEPLTDNS